MTKKSPDDRLRLPCDDGDCDGATTPSRRDFLQTAGGCFGVSLALLGLSSVDAGALPVLMTEGTQSGSERRYAIPDADSVNVDRSAQLIVTRFQGKVFVFALSCPHQNNVVKWLPKDHRFQCTKHDSQYQPNGTYTAGRATRNMDRYIVRRDGSSVVVDLHRWVQSDKDPAGWAAAAIDAS